MIIYISYRKQYVLANQIKRVNNKKSKRTPKLWRLFKKRLFTEIIEFKDEGVGKSNTEYLLKAKYYCCIYIINNHTS